MVRGGASWSGRERNCAYLNVEGGRFANISGISGLDWLDDGRALATCDWDRDGDLDLWFKNRTGPQLRYMRNNGPAGNFVSLLLEGGDCNKDAIGTRVEVWVSGRPLVQTVQAGSGYLAQSSRRLHFGLGTATEIERIEVRWPGGNTETLPQATVGVHLRYLQGSGSLQTQPANDVSGTQKLPVVESPVLPPAKPDNRTVLRQPFPLPENWLDDGPNLGEGFGLVTFWAQWCPICRHELTEFGKHEDRLQQAGIRIIPLNLDPSADQEKARKAAGRFGLDSKFRAISPSQSALIAAVLRSALDLHGELPIPMNVLLDSKGNILAIYRGPVSVEDILKDRKVLSNDARTSPRDSERWVSPATRRYQDVVNELKRARHLDWARYYLKLDRSARGR
jgi:peroxiredoxin